MLFTSQEADALRLVIDAVAFGTILSGALRPFPNGGR